jgi:hypothetical protein
VNRAGEVRHKFQSRPKIDFILYQCSQFITVFIDLALLFIMNAPLGTKFSIVVNSNASNIFVYQCREVSFHPNHQYAPRNTASIQDFVP